VPHSEPYTVVAAAIIDGDPPALLAAQRAYPPELAGRWELPGGKVHDGEDDVAALVRELQEELGIEAVVGERAAPDVTTIDGRGVLHVYWATVLDGEPQALEHASLRWLPAAALYDVDWLAADLPVVAAIAATMGAS
jgi:8-oxo-dGTP diphosphatase